MKLTFPRTLGFAAIGITAALALPGAASAGKATYTTECGANGDTIAHIQATNSWTQVRVNGVVIHDEDGDGIADLTTGPGVYSIEWWGPSTDGNRVQHPELPFIVISEHPTVLTIPARTDCVPEQTETSAAPTTSEAPTESTPPPPASTIDTATTLPPQQTSACEQERDEGNDICNLGTPPPAIDQVTELPATGSGGDILLIAGIVVLVAGSALMLVRRRPA